MLGWEYIAIRVESSGLTAHTLIGRKGWCQGNYQSCNILRVFSVLPDSWQGSPVFAGHV